MSPDPSPAERPIGSVHSNSARAGAIVWWVLAVILAVDTVHRAHGRESVVTLALLVLASLGAYAVAWHPAVAYDDETLTIVNPLRTITVPWAAVTSIGGSWSLEVRTERGTFTPWVSGPRSRRDLRRNITAGVASELHGRWERVARDPDRAAEISVRPDVAVLILVVSLVAAIVLALLL